MRISVTIFAILISTYVVNSSVLDPVIENVVHLQASTPPSGVPGIWKKKTIWKPRWVKEWKSAKVMKPIWRKVWSPVQIREWMPIPKPPPGWASTSTKLIPVHQKPQKATLKDSFAHDSYTIQSKVPLWDPLPYPESQQPPPPPISQPLYHTDNSCGIDGCDNVHSQTFNNQQISEIIGKRYETPEHFQNPEYSETVNHLTRFPPEENIWKPPQPFPVSQSNFLGLPEFLIPPKYQENNFPHSPNPNVLISQSPGFEIQNSSPKWILLPPIKGHFVTKAPDQPQKVLGMNLQQNKTSSVQTKSHSDFIQEAELVGEYHYSVFDELNVTPLPSLLKEQVKVKPVENKQKLEVPNDQTAQINKKHIPHLHSQQVENIKEISPSHKTPQIPKPTTENPNSTQIYPIYEIPQKVNPIFTPTQHRFFQPTIVNTTKSQPALDKTNRVQIVFATTPDDNQTTERTTTTTEPYEIVFASSLRSTTETTTRSPVIVVTPANFNKS